MTKSVGALTLRGWKGYDVADVPLWPVTLLIGPNGSGKSSLLEALALVAHLGRRGSLREDLRPWLRGWPDRVFTRKGDGTSAERVEIAMTWVDARYRLVLVDPERPRIDEEELRVRENTFIKTRNDHTRAYTGATRGRPLETREPAESALGLITRAASRRKPTQRLIDLLTRIEVYALDADFLRGTAVDTRPTPYHRKGTNLVSGLLDAKNDKPTWSRLHSAIQAVQPDLEEIVVTERPRGVLLHYTDGRETQLDEESDGLVRAVGMFLVRYRGDCPAILGYDEPENGLHLSRLVDVVSRLAPDRPRSRKNPRIVFLATHSPEMVRAAVRTLGDSAGALTLWRGTDGRVAVHAWSGADLADEGELELLFAEGFHGR
jgi:predicted ATPase